MIRTRIKLGVYVDLDPMPGAFNTPDSAKQAVLSVLNMHISHYNPSVVIDSRDVSKPDSVPPAEGLIEGVLDELKEARDALRKKFDNNEPANGEVNLVLSLIDQITEERMLYKGDQYAK
jgi:hypothetical protein